MNENREQAAARAAIRPVKEAIEDELIAKAGVVGVDIAEKETDGVKTGELSIVVFVEEKLPKTRLRKADMVPAEIDGIKTDVQELTIELQPAMRLVEDGELQLDPNAYPILAGGIGIGPQRQVHLAPPDVPSAGNYVFVGTLGAMVRDRTSGATMALTNFHVACVNNTWRVGDRQVQPSLVDGGVTSDDFGSLTRAALSENIDGAVIRVDAGRGWSATVTGIGDVNGSVAATVGMDVQKRGRTTEHTFGRVVSVDATVSVNYGSDVGSRTLRRQIRIAPDTTRSPRFSNSGDSGSVVMDTNRNVVGLLFAGARDGSATFANPIRAALDELSVDLLVPPGVVATRPLISCLNTRLAICGAPTRSIAACWPHTRTSALCNVMTRGPICGTTRPDLCAPTRSVTCFVTRPNCVIPTRTCGEFEWPGDRWIPKGGQGGYGGSVDVPVGMSAAEDDYWAGYLAALEEIAVLEQEDES